MKPYRIRIKIQNNLLLSAIEEAGYKTQAAFSRTAGLHVADVNALVAMREAPIMASGEFSNAARLIMETLGAAPNDLWTDDQLYRCLSRNSTAVSVGATFIEELREYNAALLRTPSPEEAFEKSAWRGSLLNGLQKLPDRKRAAVLLMYDKEYTLKEIGQALQVTQERARQMVIEGIKVLRRELTQ